MTSTVKLLDETVAFCLSRLVAEGFPEQPKYIDVADIMVGGQPAAGHARAEVSENAELELQLELLTSDVLADDPKNWKADTFAARIAEGEARLVIETGAATVIGSTV